MTRPVLAVRDGAEITVAGGEIVVPGGEDALCLDKGRVTINGGTIREP